MRNKEKGFTLIELVVVIIILGVLAVIAAPKFTSLKEDAYASTMQGVAGALNSSKDLIHAACVISASCDENAAPATGNGLGNSIVVQGESITLAYGYPRHTDAGIARMTNIADTSNEGEFELASFTSGGRPGIRIRPNANYSANQCEVRYSQPQAAGDTPLVEIEISGC